MDILTLVNQIACSISSPLVRAHFILYKHVYMNILWIGTVENIKRGERGRDIQKTNKEFTFNIESSFSNE